MVRQVKVEFAYDEFISSHGRMPKGRGSWAFSVERDPKVDQLWFSPSCTLVEARKLAAEHFRARLAVESAAPLTGDALIVLYVQP